MTAARRALPSLVLLSFASAVLSTATQPQGPPATAAATARTQIQDFVRAYVDAANRMDIAAAMEMMSRRREVSSVEDGTITRGWDAIRAAADEMLGMEGQFRVAVGSIDITLLGASNALVLAPTTVTLKDEQGQSVQVRGALSLVLERVAGAWKVLHEHHSIKVEQ